MAVVAKKLTWDDIKDWPEDQGRTEIVDGDLVVSPPASDRHQEIATILGAKIYPFVKRNDLGKFYSNAVHVVLAEHVNYEPDLIIEIISDSNRTHDTVVKYQHYEKYGVKEYWLVDPRDEVIRVLRLEGDRYQSLGTFGRGERVATRVLEGLELDPQEIF